MRLLSSMSEASFYPSEPHPIITGQPGALILLVSHRSRLKPICCRLYSPGRCQAGPCALISFITLALKIDSLLFSGEIPAQDDPGKPARERPGKAVLQPPPHRFGIILPLLSAHSRLSRTCKYFIALPALCFLAGWRSHDQDRRSSPAFQLMERQLFASL